MILVCDGCKNRINTRKETAYVYLPVQSFYCQDCFDDVIDINFREGGMERERTMDETIVLDPERKPNPAIP